MSYSSKTMLLALAVAPLLSMTVAQSLNGIGMGWADSYSIGGRCYCQTTFDHAIGGIMVDGPGGSRITVRKACELAGEGPLQLDGERRVFYNTVQCGNRPYNNAWDETACPGRVDLGKGVTSGCQTTGPKWYFGPTPSAPKPVEASKAPATKAPATEAPVVNPPAPQPAPPSAQGKFFSGVAVVDVSSLAKKTFSNLNAATIIAADYPNGFTIEALVKDVSAVASVFFESSMVTRREGLAPYVFTGNSGNNFNQWFVGAGTNADIKITATGKDGSKERITAKVKVV